MRQIPDCHPERKVRDLIKISPAVEMTEEKPGVGSVERRETHRPCAYRFALCALQVFAGG